MVRRSIVPIVITALLLTPLAAQATSRTETTHLRLSVRSTQVHIGHRVTFKIHLASAWSRCQANQPVKWFKNGVYRRTLITGPHGSVRIRRRLQHTATFQAKYLGRRWGTYPDRNVCYASASKAVTITVGH